MFSDLLYCSIEILDLYKKVELLTKFECFIPADKD